MKTTYSASPTKEVGPTATAKEADKPKVTSSGGSSSESSTSGGVKRLKYEMCKNWREKGSCKYGDKCLFAHGEKELTKRSSAPPKPEPVIVPKLEEVKPELEKKDILDEVSDKEVSEKSKEAEGNSAETTEEVLDVCAERFETPVKNKQQLEYSSENCLGSTQISDSFKSTPTKEGGAQNLANESTKIGTRFSEDEDETEEDDKAGEINLLLDGDLNELLGSEILKVSLPTNLNVGNGIVTTENRSTNPSSISKSPLAVYADHTGQSIPSQNASHANSQAGSTHRSSFDDTLYTFSEEVSKGMPGSRSNHHSQNCSNA